MHPTLGALAVVACALVFSTTRWAAADDTAAEQSVSADDLLRHIRVLSSDEFEGRAPGTPGEQKTVDYLVGRFNEMGLAPGNSDGTFIQNVPLVGFTAKPTISLSARGRKTDLRFPGDSVVWTRRPENLVKVENTDVVFVGYGVDAPEYGWDDFKGTDVRGKTILFLINDPPVSDPNDPQKLDENLFRGRAMTYYGRWTYKYEIAARKGAAAAIIVHETGPAGYPWLVIAGSSGRENMDLAAGAADADRAAIEGWITADAARRLLAGSGHDFDVLKDSARRRDFKPVSLDVQADFVVENSTRSIASRNVIVKIEGADPMLKNEWLIYTAHWDHIGRDSRLEGDSIYNGALDNASGVAALLELAEAFTKVKPRRTVAFLAVTAEEKGLLGAKHYASNPIHPLNRTVANINIDGVNVWGPTSDLGVVGVGQSTLEDILKTFVDAQRRTLVPESQPEKGFYFRSDHFEFAKVGVPALYTQRGIDYIGKDRDFGRRRSEQYIDRDYHKPTDQIQDDWDLSGAAEDVRLLFQVGYAVTQADGWPQWKPGSEFKARREAMVR